jgi:hypothetical protein
VWSTRNAIPLDVVVKLAFDVEQRKALVIEYDVYRRLRLKEVNQGVTWESQSSTLGIQKNVMINERKMKN